MRMKNIRQKVIVLPETKPYDHLLARKTHGSIRSPLVRIPVFRILESNLIPCYQFYLKYCSKYRMLKKFDPLNFENGEHESRIEVLILELNTFLNIFIFTF